MSSQGDDLQTFDPTVPRFWNRNGCNETLLEHPDSFGYDFAYSAPVTASSFNSFPTGHGLLYDINWAGSGSSPATGQFPPNYVPSTALDQLPNASRYDVPPRSRLVNPASGYQPSPGVSYLQRAPARVSRQLSMAINNVPRHSAHARRRSIERLTVAPPAIPPVHRCPYPDCNAATRRPSDLERHINNVHERAKKIHKCATENCKFASYRPDKIREHCEKCGQRSYLTLDADSEEGRGAATTVHRRSPPARRSPS